VALGGPLLALEGLTSPHVWHYDVLFSFFSFCKGYLRGRPHLLFILTCYVEKCARFSSYKEASATFNQIITFLTLVWGTLLKFYLFSLFGYFLLCTMLEGGSLWMFALLDG
jgi:hypothetical protein